MIIDKIKKRQPIPSSKKANVDIPAGKWTKCENCKNIIYKEELRDNLSMCPNCGNYFKLHINGRLEQILDEGSYKRFDYDLETTNPLDIDGYLHKVELLRQMTNILEAVSIGTGKINGEELIICVMDSGFLMGSMGTVVGEKITYAMEQAIKLDLPIVIFTASGGARMQEGILSLMQMAKTTEAVSKLNDAGILYISVLTDPTYGGVTASFASLGDVIIAEPHARIGFAGRKVIEQTIGNKLPEDFQTSEFLLEHGFIDKIVERKDLRDTIYNIIKFHKKEALK